MCNIHESHQLRIVILCNIVEYFRNFICGSCLFSTADPNSSHNYIIVEMLSTCLLSLLLLNFIHLDLKSYPCWDLLFMLSLSEVHITLFHLTHVCNWRFKIIWVMFAAECVLSGIEILSHEIYKARVNNSYFLLDWLQ